MQKYLTKQLFTKTNNCHAVRLVEKKKNDYYKPLQCLQPFSPTSDARYQLFILNCQLHQFFSKGCRLHSSTIF